MQPDQPVQSPSLHKPSLQMGMLVFLTLFLGGTLLFMVSRLSAPVKEENATQTHSKEASPTPSVGTMKLVKPLANEFQIVADSQGHSIVGFDALVVYDANTLTVTQVTSADSNFQISSFKRPGFISITATKSLAQKGDIVLKGTPVVTIQAQLKGQSAQISVVSANGNETTKMIDSKSQKLFPALN